ncbi:hypothetical protein ElyMa_003779100 [Elysia marginata]|uniref:CARMIL C-terminal domain-containing protein n=1 Tax=Elysia marginata TaxID=1093978 RepID=A0AAV4FA96_9GAST|nr:hypothetical protein ElyMa_003779100 [Elysia marginata]
MDKEKSEIPEWKIPPVENVCRRDSGSHTQKTVLKRRTSRSAQSDDSGETSFTPQLNAKTLANSSQWEQNNTRLHSNIESYNSQKPCADALGDSYQLLYDQSGSKMTQNKAEGKQKMDKRNSREEIYENRVDLFCPRRVTEEQLDLRKIESLRKRSLSPGREQPAVHVRPRSKSLHLGHHQEDQCIYGRVQQCPSPSVDKKQQAKSQTLPTMRSDYTTQSEKILGETDPYHDDAGPIYVLVTESLKYEDKTRENAEKTSEHLLESMNLTGNDGGLSTPSLRPHGADTQASKELSGSVNKFGAVSCKDIEESSSPEYDTDCEPDEYSFLNGLEGIAKKMKEDVDIGHLTYESACVKFGVKPRRSVLSQLKQRALSVPNGGLLTAEIHALGQALKVNNRIENVDLSGNFLTPEALRVISEAMIDNVNVVKLVSSISYNLR